MRAILGKSINKYKAVWSNCFPSVTFYSVQLTEETTCDTRYDAIRLTAATGVHEIS